MAEHVKLQRHTYEVLDGETKKVVEMGEMVPVGASGKKYNKSYVSLPDKGGWFVKDDETGEILSTNPVIGNSDADAFEGNSRRMAMIAPSTCPTCKLVFQNHHYLEQHSTAVHGADADAVRAQHLTDEEEKLQAALKGQVCHAPGCDRPIVMTQSGLCRSHHMQSVRKDRATA